MNPEDARRIVLAHRIPEGYACRPALLTPAKTPASELVVVSEPIRVYSALDVLALEADERKLQQEQAILRLMRR
jgi:hypothetical protein